MSVIQLVHTLEKHPTFTSPCWQSVQPGNPTWLQTLVAVQHRHSHREADVLRNWSGQRRPYSW